MDTQTFPFAAPPQPARPIKLRIAGADLLLSGRFEQWVPLALADARAEGAVQLLFDVTSPASRSAVSKAPDLFSFNATDVEATGPQTYRAKGTLRAGGVVRATEALLHNPVGHSPFFIVTLSIDRATFGELWSELEDRATVAAGQKELRPRAWLRVPHLAAA